MKLIFSVLLPLALLGNLSCGEEKKEAIIQGTGSIGSRAATTQEPEGQTASGVNNTDEYLAVHADYSPTTGIARYFAYAGKISKPGGKCFTTSPFSLTVPVAMPLSPDPLGSSCAYSGTVSAEPGQTHGVRFDGELRDVVQQLYYEINFPEFSVSTMDDRVGRTGGLEFEWHGPDLTDGEYLELNLHHLETDIHSFIDLDTHNCTWRSQDGSGTQVRCPLRVANVDQGLAAGQYNVKARRQQKVNTGIGSVIFATVSAEFSVTVE